MTKRLILLLFALAALATGALACGFRRTPTPTPTPLPLQAPGWEEVTVYTLCLEVEQSYPQIEEEFSQPIGEATERILAGLGLQVVPEGEPCDATLSITLTGQALEACYGELSEYGFWFEHGCFYSGAEVTGQMTLALPGHEPLTLPLSGNRPTQEEVTKWVEDRVSPAQAPFGSAWSEALLDGLADLWGYQVLIKALEDKDSQVRLRALIGLSEVGPEEEVVSALIRLVEDDHGLAGYRAAEVLGDFGPEAKEAIPALIQALRDKRNADRRKAAAYALGKIGPEAVPALIQALGDSYEWVRYRAVQALEEITGQDFGQDPDRWQQWWEEQTPVMGTPSGGVITYTVQAGDTLAKIAAEFGVTVEAIVEANDMEDPSLINVEQVLVIPKP